MHKKLASELNSLAHKILQMNNKDNVFLLQKKAHEIYEKLSVLAYIEEYINNTPQATETKETLIKKFEESLKYKASLTNKEETTTHKEIIETPKVEEITEQPFDELENLLFKDDSIKNEASFIEETKAPRTLEDELQGTPSVDVTANLFEQIETKATLNDRLQNSIQVDLNDRIAFVKHLFNGNQSDFNRVISQLNTFKTEKEAKSFIKKMVKPDYNWTEKEEYETRLLEIIERKFA